MIWYLHLYLFVAETHCPIGFDFYEGRCFRKYYTPLKTWSGAKQICNAHNENQNIWSSLLPHHHFELASVRNSAENEFIKRMLDDNDPTGYSPHSQPWIGLYQSDSASWVIPTWSDHTVVRYENWAPNEPADYQVCKKFNTGFMWNAII